jgi:putative transposase
MAEHVALKKELGNSDWGLGSARYADLRESMTEAEIEIILERAKEQYPGVRPRVISDNGPQFIAKDFKEFIRISGMTHVRT